LPGIWLGNEDNARDVETLSRLGIKAILNVAKEVSGVDEIAAAHGLAYLGLDWSHGEKNLVKDGFPAGFTFVDSARQNGGGVLVQ
jgi:tyrosine-protein phosphatase MSG5